MKTEKSIRIQPNTKCSRKEPGDNNRRDRKHLKIFKKQLAPGPNSTPKELIKY
jgi:hypothetical protein